MTFIPRSNRATVVPTGAFFCPPSPILASAIDTKRLPLSTSEANSVASVPEGSLYGRGIIASRMLPPGASMSLNSPGCSGSSSFRTLTPRALNPAGRLASVPASINCLRILVAARPNPPNICISPEP